MTDTHQFLAALFKSVSHAMKAEQLLKDAGIPFKLIPVPKSISSDCGVCIRFAPADREALMKAMDGRVDIEEIRAL
jgi:hypothetical protein